RPPRDADRKPPPLLRHGRRGDAPDPRRLRASAQCVEARRRRAAARAAEAALNMPVDLRLDFERMDQALVELAQHAPEKARVVELRYFAGLSIEETAMVMDVSPATVKRHWTFARAWLFRAMQDGDSTPPPD